MGTINSNRDLYVAVADLIAQNRECEPPLEEYLRALLAAGRSRREQPFLSADELLELLAGAFTFPAVPFDESWRSRYAEDRENRSGFDGWEARLLRQIVDLREMMERGILQDEHRYFGIASPRGQQWFNFDPCTFLECATEGSYRGWRAGDTTGRNYVPGPVAVVGDDGELTSCDPRDIPEVDFTIQGVSWDDFRDFLGQGQWYE